MNPAVNGVVSRKRNGLKGRKNGRRQVSRTGKVTIKSIHQDKSQMRRNQVHRPPPPPRTKDQSQKRSNQVYRPPPPPPRNQPSKNTNNYLSHRQTGIKMEQRVASPTNTSPSRHSPFESKTESSDQVLAFEDGEEELTDSILEELDTLEQEYEEKKKRERLYLADRNIPNNRTMIEYFTQPTFESALTRNPNIFELKFILSEESGQVQIILSSKCWQRTGLKTAQFYAQEVKYSRTRIIYSRCTCGFEKCVHCCSTVQKFCWFRSESVGKTKNGKLLEACRDLEGLKVKYNQLLVEMSSPSKNEEIEIHQKNKIIPPPPPHIVPPPMIPGRKKKMKFEEEEEEEEEEIVPRKKKKKKKKKVSWRVPLVDIRTIEPRKNTRRSWISRLQSRRKHNGGSAMNHLPKNSMDLLCSYNSGKKLVGGVPVQQRSSNGSLRSEEKKIGKKRKRGGMEGFNGIAEKENQKRRKIE